MEKKMVPELEKHYCSFCKKDNNHVEKLIVGDGKVCICNECVALCVDILNDRTKPIKIDLTEKNKS